MAKAQEEILLLLEIHREHADDIALEGGQPMVMFMIGAKGKTAEGETIKAGWRINGLRKESGANLSIVDPRAKEDGEGLTLPQLRLTGTRDAIDKARAMVEASLEEYARQNVSINFDATKHASMLIGNKGAKINALQKELGVKMDLNRASGKIVFRGDEEKVAAAQVRRREEKSL